MSSKINTYEVVVIGSELVSILTAQKLALSGRRVALVPTKESLEDFRKDHSATDIKLNEPSTYIPFSSRAEGLINWLEDQFFSPKSLYSDIQEQPPVTFEGGQFKPFLGFGERALKTMDALQYYLCPKRFSLTLTPQEWADKIIKEAQFDLLDRSTITSFEIAEKQIVSATINGSKLIKADEFIFCSSPKELLKLLDNKVFAGRERQRLAKANLWSRINLSIEYKESFTHQPGMHVLMGSKDDFEPMVGEFFTLNETLFSQWSYLLNEDQFEDAEVSGGVIKYMKRQLKRAYPESFDLIKSEKITVHGDTHGPIEGLFVHLNIKNINNLYIAGPQLSDAGGVLSSLDMSQKIIAELMGPQVAPLNSSEEAAPL